MFPDDLRYTPEHEWVRREGPTALVFGITAHAAEALGDVVFVQLPEPGAALSAGEPCGEVESTKSVSDVFAPVAGEVAAVNEALESAPELVNAEPYDRGWMVEVACPDAEAADAAWGGLLTAEQYRAGLA